MVRMVLTSQYCLEPERCRGDLHQIYFYDEVLSWLRENTVGKGIVKCWQLSGRE